MPDISTYNGIDMADIASINGQDAPSGGGGSSPATTAPSVSVSSGAFGITATITKSGGGAYTNPNYSASAALTSDASTVTVTDANMDRSVESDGTHLAGTLTFVDTNAAGGERTISVKAQEFGDTIQSAAGTATYTKVTLQNQFIRIRGTTSDGSDSNNRIAISDINFYTGAGQTGTVYPTTNLTGDGSETGIAVQQGHVYNSTYAAWKACDSSTSSMAWLLGTSAANNWWEIEFEDATYGTKPIILSMDIMFHSQTDAGYFTVVGSDVADFSSSTSYGVFTITAESTVLNFG